MVLLADGKNESFHIHKERYWLVDPLEVNLNQNEVNPVSSVQQRSITFNSIASNTTILLEIQNILKRKYQYSDVGRSKNGHQLLLRKKRQQTRHRQ